jgi:hypothetical protein
MYFDGSDVGLSAGSENVDGAAVAAGGAIYFSTEGGFSIPIPGPDFSGANEDIFVCAAPVTGSASSCTGNAWSLFFDGSAFGLTGNDIDAFDLP